MGTKTMREFDAPFLEASLQVLTVRGPRYPVDGWCRLPLQAM